MNSASVLPNCPFITNKAAPLRGTAARRQRRAQPRGGPPGARRATPREDTTDQPRSHGMQHRLRTQPSCRRIVLGADHVHPCALVGDTEKLDWGGIVGAVIGATIVVAFASFLIKRFAKREAV